MMGSSSVRSAASSGMPARSRASRKFVTAISCGTCMPTISNEATGAAPSSDSSGIPASRMASPYRATAHSRARRKCPRLIEDVVQDGNTLVGQANLVHIRVNHAATIVGIGLGERAPLMVDIATRLLDLCEQGLNQMKTVLVHSAQKKPLSSEIGCVLKGTHGTSSAGNRGHQVANARERGGSHLVGTAVIDVALIQRNERTAHTIGARGGGQRLDDKPDMRRLLYQARVTARSTKPPASTPATS